MSPQHLIVDRVTSSVLASSFSAIAEEMHRNLIRSAYSTIVRESRDASTALLTPEGSLLAQGRSTIPVLLGAFTPIMEELRSRGLLDDVRSGDAFITNDPYAGGQHLDDIALIAPIFVEGRLIGYAGSMAHHIDIGAAEPGLNPLATTLRQEGLRIPPLKIDLDRDLGADGVLLQIIGANIRVPEQTLGDIRAQIAAIATGQRRMAELVGRFGAEVIRAGMIALLDHSETMMRHAVSGLPDGSYRAVQYLDDLGDPGTRLPIVIRVDVDGEDIHVDFEGTAPQSSHPVNAPRGSTLSSVSTALSMLFDALGVPVNAGSQRVLSVHIPQGSVLNPVEPAPVSARMSACFKAFDAFMEALVDVLPDAVIAPSFSAVAAVALSRQEDGRTHIYREALGGGMGAGEGYDGADGVAITLTNTANVPTEFAEANFPFFRVESYRLRDSPSAGDVRSGGRGVQKSYRILQDGVQFAAYSDRHHAGPEGVRGGAAGEAGSFTVMRGAQTIELDPLTVFPLERGDLLCVRTAGGGSWGEEQGR